MRGEDVRKGECEGKGVRKGECEGEGVRGRCVHCTITTINEI